jgi:hypothetical protein
MAPQRLGRQDVAVRVDGLQHEHFEERIIFLGVQIDDTSANDVTTQRYLHPDKRAIWSAGDSLSAHLRAPRSPNGPQRRSS